MGFKQSDMIWFWFKNSFWLLFGEWIVWEMSVVSGAVNVVPEKCGDGYAIRIEEEKEVAGWSDVPCKEKQTGILMGWMGMHEEHRKNKW